MLGRTVVLPSAPATGLALRGSVVGVGGMIYCAAVSDSAVWVVVDMTSGGVNVWQVGTKVDDDCIGASSPPPSRRRWNLNRHRFTNRYSNLPIPQVATRPLLSLPAKDATRTPTPKPLTHHHLGVVVVSPLPHAQHPISNTPYFSPTRPQVAFPTERCDCSSNTAVSIPTNNTIPTNKTTCIVPTQLRLLLSPVCPRVA